MPILEVKENIIVSSYNEFCLEFNIQTDKVAGDHGTDEELIIYDLNKYYNEKNWIINFIDDKNDGYFILQTI